MKQLLIESLDVLDGAEQGSNDRFYIELDADQIDTLSNKLRAAINAPEQAPVAWINPAGTIAWSQQDMDNFDDDIRWRYSVPLYTKPQPVTELTEDEIRQCRLDTEYDGTPSDPLIHRSTHSRFVAFARAVLTAQKAKSKTPTTKSKTIDMSKWVEDLDMKRVFKNYD